MRNFKVGYAIFIAVAIGAALSELRGSNIMQQAYTLIQDEGTSLARRTTLNFTGAGVTCADGGGKTGCDIPGGLSTAYQTIQDEGTPLTQRTTLNFTGAGVTCSDGGGITGCDIPGGVTTAYQTVQDEGVSLTQRSTLNFTGAGITCNDGSGKTNCDVPLAAAPVHAITFVIDGGGSAIATGGLALFPTADFACTINRTDISADQSGSITVDVWKKAGAIPSGADKISASAPVTLSSAQLDQNGSISGWTTGVSVGDVFGGTIASASTVQRVTVQIWCQ